MVRNIPDLSIALLLLPTQDQMAREHKKMEFVSFRLAGNLKSFPERLKQDKV
jgi:hypothetical protein